MTTRRARILAAAAAALLAAAGCGRDRTAPDVEPVSPEIRRAVAAAPLLERLPRTFPDFDGIVIPPNLCPVNLLVEEPGRRCHARLSSAHGEPIEAVGDHTVTWSPDAWRRLLRANRGGPLRLQLAVEDASGQWQRFPDAVATVAAEEIDPYLVYRIVGKANWVNRNVSLHQRDLETFNETTLLDSMSINRGCMNCHAFAAGDPSTMVLHVRATPAGGMMLVRGGTITRVDTRSRFNPTPAKYISVHPGRRLAAFAESELVLFDHTIGESSDVFDAGSNLAIYRFDTHTVSTTPALCDKARQETYPSWSPDGRHLYFSSAPALAPEQWKDIRYDLMRIAYDEAGDAWGPLETVLSAAETGKSITHPRVSPDGRFLLFCMSDRGVFPIWQRDADLYLMDLANGARWRVEASSDEAESWHGWSSNGRWVVFSSRRRDGVLTKLYLTHVDREGRTSKPLILPQEDPAFYNRFLLMYNLPEFAVRPVPFNREEMIEALRTSHAVEAGLDPKVPPRVPADKVPRDAAPVTGVE